MSATAAPNIPAKCHLGYRCPGRASHSPTFDSQGIRKSQSEQPEVASDASQPDQSFEVIRLGEKIEEINRLDLVAVLT